VYVVASTGYAGNKELKALAQQARADIVEGQARNMDYEKL
jgi:hypothetical protein